MPEGTDCVPYGDAEFTATLSAEDVTYSGQPYEPGLDLEDGNVKLILSDGFPEECVVETVEVSNWYDSDGNVMDEAPTDAGEYSVQVKINSDGRDRWLWAYFKIIPKELVVTLPIAKKNLVYNTKAQVLAEEGSIMDGEDPSDDFGLQYAVTEKGKEPKEDDYKGTIDSKTDAGKYDIWCRAVPADEVNPYNYDFGEEVVWEIIEGKVYFDEPVPAEIGKATPEVTAPVAKTLTYNTQAQELAEAGKTTGGTMLYALGTSATTAPTDGWSTSVPKGTNVGSYYVWYKVAGDKNYNDVGPACVTATIAARQFTISYDLNGGKLDGQTGTVTMVVEEGTVITLPSPTRDGYTFDYWEGSKYNAGDKYTVSGDHTFKAVWKTSGSGKKGNGVNTGDTNDIAGLLALMLVSVGALGALRYRRRKEDQ